MTKLFTGHKPGVGWVVKTLRYDGDDPLTLANSRFSRYYFNSETSQLSYVLASEPFAYNAQALASLGTDFDLHGTSATAKISGVKRTYKGFVQVDSYYRINNIFPELSYPPIPEIRRKDLATNRIEAGRRSVQLLYDDDYEAGYVESYQFQSVMMRVTGHDGSTNVQQPQMTYNGRILGNLGRVRVGEWVIPSYGHVYDDNRRQWMFYPHVWDLPANQSPLRTYQYKAGLTCFYQGPTGLFLSRPGFDIYSPGLHTQIMNSNRSPALCIMAGERRNIAPGASVTLFPPPGIKISETATTEFMYRRVGEPWHVPGFIASGYVRNTRFDLTYTVQNDSVTIYNDGTFDIDIRYMVFNVDRQGTSTGGKIIRFNGDDGQRKFIQIKKPGTSDPASMPNDIMLDTRFPSPQIVAEGFISLSSFSDAPGEDHQHFGKKKATVSFNSDGVLLFLKFSIVFPNSVSTPYMSLAYDFGRGSTWGPPSNTSMIGRLDDNQVSFWANPGSWSRRYKSGTNVNYAYDIPDPIGVRYYVFGLVIPD